MGSPEASTQTVCPRYASTSATVGSKGTVQGRAMPRIKGAANARCRAPPKTTLADRINSRAAGANPSIPSSPIPTMDSQRCSPAGWGRTSSASDMRKRILILGGTTEAREFAQALAARGNVEATLSLAGRTAAPLPQSVPVRRGGFGGTAGLIEYMRKRQIGALVDATHPFAAMISAHAQSAASQTNTPMITLSRPPWSAVAGDQWVEVQSVQEAVSALGLKARHAFLALGRQELAPFASAPQHHYWIRSVDPVGPALAVPHAQYILARGPFEEAQERPLLQ